MVPKKLSEEQVIDIKHRLMNGEKQSDIALLYNVSQGTISNIALNEAYTEYSFEGWNPNLIRHSRKHILAGKTFGNLYVIKENGFKWNGVLWQCKCLLCGNVIGVDEGRLLNGKRTSCGCTRDYNLLDISGQTFGNITILERNGTAKDGSAMWKYRCLRCGNTSTARGKDIVYGKVNSCGCITSKGEETITKFLKENGVDFKAQYTFSDLVSSKGRVLRFDFGILDENNLVCLIEYQGPQHYMNDVKMGSLQRNETDKKKRDYCQMHGIPLYEISYKDDISSSLQTILFNASQSCAKPV